MPDTPEPAGAITLVGHALSTLVARRDMPIQSLPSTLPRDAGGIVRRMNAMGQSSLEMDRDGTLLIEVQDVVAYWRDSVDPESGEVHEFSWLVLIDPRGETWGTSSECVARKVSQIVTLWSAGLLSRPTPVQVVTRTGRRSGRHYHDIILIGD